MQITLYKSCPITNDYKVVWNNATDLGTGLNNIQTAHDKLLNSLTKKTIDIDDIYLDDSGELYLDLEDVQNLDWFNDYNYMSYEIQRDSGNNHIKTEYLDNSNLSLNYIYNYLNDVYTSTYATAYYGRLRANYLKRYAFINSIEYSNDSIKIKYSCDIWSTYSPFIEYGTGDITRFSDECIYKLKKSAEIHTLTIEDDYFSNSELLKYSLIGNSHISTLVGNRNCYCFATIQYYTLNAQGKQTERWLDSVMLARGTASGQSGFTKNSFIAKVDEWNEYITEFMTYQSTGSVYANPNTHYEIQDVYLIPLSMCQRTDAYNFDKWLDNLFDGNYPNLWLYSMSSVFEFDTNIWYYLLSLRRYCDDTSYTGKPKLNHTFDITSGEVANDWKRAGIGFYTRFFKVECNTTLAKFKYAIRFSFDCYNINLHLELNNKIYEITDEFFVKIPIQVNTADVTQLQAIQRSIASKKNIISGVTGAVKGVGASIIGGITAGASGGAVGGAIAGGGILGGIVGATESIANSILNDKLINANA